MKRGAAMLFTVVMIVSMLVVPAAAENVCQEITGTGEPSASVTFTVKTNGNWGKNDLKITQTKRQDRAVLGGR